MNPAADLAARWRRAVREIGAQADGDLVTRCGADLLDRWAEPHRHYHDLAHLTAVLHTLDRLAGTPSAQVRLAAWFHDAVYDGRPGADEQASAVLAERTLTDLGVAAGHVTEVGRLVRLTADHRVPPGDADGALLVDADLAVLAAGPADYARYVAAVRAEYAHLDDATFAAGRAAVLGSLLHRPTLFCTPTGRALFDDAARANLTAEIDGLTRGSQT